MNKEWLRNLSIKSKQQMLLIGLSSIFLALVGMGAYFWDNAEPLIPVSIDHDKPSTKNITTPGTQVDPREVWMSQSATQMQEMNEVITSLKQKITDLEKQGRDAGKEKNDPANFFKQPLENLPPPLPDSSDDPVRAEPVTGDKNAGTGYLPPPQPYLPPAPQQAKQSDPGIEVFRIDTQNKPQEATRKDKKNTTYIPSGSFARSILLGGMDAPTGGQAQNNPMPALLKIHDNAVLPNSFRAKVKECFVLGAGHGDISSERAQIRLESFSCVLKNGKVIDLPAKGYVVSEDGKAGLRGRLVTKQGQIIANALLTGILSGFGQALQQSGMSYSSSALGSVGTISGMGNQLKSGFGAGVGRAMDRISRYYIKLAEQLFPVIEVDAGRVVEIVLTKGLEIELEDDQASMLNLETARNKPRRLQDRRG